MSTGQLATVLGQFHGLVASWNCDGFTDGQLLEAYVTRHDPAAFAALVRRHGPLVLNICRSVLHNEHDAEDAFQAAFLILARKAGSIRQLTSAGGWLCRVAYNVAYKARSLQRTQACRSPQPERQVDAVPSSDPVLALARQELCAALTEELTRLPEKYRAPLVLCYLEGQTTGEAAQRLGWPRGTVKVRLMQARELLRKRLSRRGFSLPAAGVVSLLIVRAASAAVSSALVQNAVRTAALVASGQAGTSAALPASVARLAEGPLLTLGTARLKGLLAAMLVVGLLLAGVGEFIHRAPVVGQSTDAGVPAALPRPVVPPGENKPAATGTATALLPVAVPQTFQHDSAVTAVAVSPSGQLLAAAGRDGWINVWDCASRRRLTHVRAFAPAEPLAAESSAAVHNPQLWLSSLLFPDDHTLCAGLRASAGAVEVILWDVPVGSERRRLPTDCDFAVAPGGKTLATTRGRALVLSDVHTGRELVIDRSPARSAPVALATDGLTAALADRAQTIQLWDLAAGRQVQRFPVEVAGPVPRPRSGLVFSADGRLVTAGGSWDGTLRIWDVGTGQESSPLTVYPGLIHSVVFSPDGKRLAAAARDESLRVIDVATGRPVHTIAWPHGEAGLTTLTFAPDGKTIVSGGTDGTIRCWPLP